MRKIGRGLASAVLGTVENSARRRRRWRGRRGPAAALPGPDWAPAVRAWLAVAAAVLVVLGGLTLGGCSVGRPAARNGGAAGATAVASPAATGSTSAPAPTANDGAAEPAISAPAPPAPPAPLVPGEPQQGDLAGGERRAYPVDLAAGDYARFSVEQRFPGDPGVDLVVTLLAPDGGKVDEVDGPGGVAGAEQLSVVATGAGTYHLVLTATDPAAPRGRYRVSLDERRAGRPGDAERVTAEKLINEARQLRTLETEEADTAALEKLNRAFAIVSRSGVASLEGDALSLIGQIHLTRGRLEEARKAYDHALAAYDRAGDSHGKAIVFVELGVTSRRSGKVEEALDYYRSALPILHEAGDVGEEANTLHSMGVAAILLGDLERANEWLNQALALWRGSADLDGEATALISLSRLELKRGRIDEVADYVELALDRSRSAGAKGTQAYCLSSLAGIKLLRGDLQGALANYLEVLEIDRVMGNARDEATVLNNVGIVYLDLGELDLALASFDRALAISSDLGLRGSQVRALCNLGLLLAKQRNPQGALAYYEQALPLSRQLSDPLTEAVTLRLIGEALVSLGQPDKAIESLNQALALQMDVQDRVREAFTRVVLGNAYMDLGDSTTARRYFDRALVLGRELENRLTESQARLGLAKLGRVAGNLQQALKEIESAVRIYEELRVGVNSDQRRASFFSGSHSYYELYLDLLMEMARREPSADYTAAAFAISERARARGLLDLLAEAHIDLAQGIAAESRVEERRLEGRIRATEQLLGEALAGKALGPGSVDQLRSELRRLDGELRRLDLQIQAKSPRYAEIRSSSPLELSAVQRLLGEGQAFLEFSVGSHASYLFAVTQDQFATFRLPAAGELQAAIEAFHVTIMSADRRSWGAYILAARRLYDILIEPAEIIIDGKTDLLIAPDGALYYVSFEALLTSDPSSGSRSELPYLVRNRAISYVPSASVLASLRVRDTARQQREDGEKLFVAFADPDYGLRNRAVSVLDPQAINLGEETTRTSAIEGRTASLPRLVESAREVQRIAEMFGEERSAVYLQTEATEANVKSNPYLRDAQWVHFATHGLIDQDRPERSGLALTPVTDSSDLDDDGVLRVGEIFSLTLRADLVVLSSCDTGLGKVLSGEGMVGLTRAFFYAGAESLVVSLWEVEDRSTADLMVAFKRRLDAGASKAEALREAKLELIATDRTATPRLWAPLVLVGNRN